MNVENQILLFTVGWKINGNNKLKDTYKHMYSYAHSGLVCDFPKCDFSKCPLIE